jgi:hypothetical protein
MARKGHFCLAINPLGLLREEVTNNWGLKQMKIDFNSLKPFSTELSEV